MHRMLHLLSESFGAEASCKRGRQQGLQIYLDGLPDPQRLAHLHGWCGLTNGCRKDLAASLAEAAVDGSCRMPNFKLGAQRDSERCTQVLQLAKELRDGGMSLGVAMTEAKRAVDDLHKCFITFRCKIQ
jgi:hypothetical protein